MTTNCEMTEMIPSQNDTTKENEEHEVGEGTALKRCQNMVKNKKCISIAFITCALILIAIIVTVIILNPFSENHIKTQGKYFF